jgi:hypothetical protein
MATRRALIVNPSANQIQEISNTDTLSAPTFSGNGTIPVGGIIMWSGSIASIPTGWALCDGSSGTPNLTDRFVVGAGSGYSVDATGGSANAVVVSHSHTASSISTSITTITDPGHNHGITDPGHNHGITDPEHNHGITDPGHTHDYDESSGDTQSGGGDDGGAFNQQQTGSAVTGISVDSNTTGISVDANSTGISVDGNSTGITASTSTETTTTVDPQGVSGTNANLPPYYALAFIMRTA